MKFIFRILLFFSIFTFGQQTITGVVLDVQTNTPISFATIKISSKYSIITDTEGNFKFKKTNDLKKITISYLGFETKTISIETKTNYVVILSPKINQLNEVKIDYESNAIALIRKVIDAKNDNNPEKKLNSFKFKSYNKLLVTANPDSIKGKVDSVFRTGFYGKKFKKIDSSDYKFKKIITKQHLYLTEKVSLFEFDKPTFKETIIGAKMAGLKEPIYEYLGINLQSLNLYKEEYSLLDTKYKSPINNKSIIEYRYKILDTTEIDNRKVILVYFKNNIKYISSKLEGVLYIDAKNYGIAKAVMQTKGVVNISGTHNYNYLKDVDIWFPSSNEFEISKGKNKEDIKVLGKTIEFDDKDDIFKSKNKNSSDFTKLISTSKFSDFEINSDVSIVRKSVVISVNNNAAKRDADFWDKYRDQKLDKREVNTYRILDSLSKNKKVEKGIYLARKLSNWYFPVSFFDIDLRQIFTYNNFEGFRLGMGGITNDNLSEIYRVEGYTGYGFKDETVKFSFGGKVRFGDFSNSWIGANYTNDLREIARAPIATDERDFTFYNSQPINLSAFYNHKTLKGYIETQKIPKTSAILSFEKSKIEPKIDYVFALNGVDYTKFNLSLATITFQCNPFSDFMQTPKGKIEIEKRFPIFTFQFSKTITSLFDNDFDFGKIDVRAEYEIKNLNGLKTSFLTQFGYGFGDIPLTHLYNTSPNNLSNGSLVRRITLAGTNSFETMYFNEFFSSTFFLLQGKHGIKRLNISKNIRPALVAVTRFAWGDLAKSEQHLGVDYKTLNKGYFESGVELNQIYRGLGLSGFFRYGAYSKPNLYDNLSIKFSYVLDLGL